MYYFTFFISFFFLFFGFLTRRPPDVVVHATVTLDIAEQRCFLNTNEIIYISIDFSDLLRPQLVIGQRPPPAVT